MTPVWCRTSNEGDENDDLRTDTGAAGVSNSTASVFPGGKVNTILSYGLQNGDDPAGTVLMIRNYDADLIQPTVTAITVNSSGGAVVPVMGMNVGSGIILVQDAAGDQGVIQCTVTSIGIASSINVVQGATYNPGNVPGFTFYIDGPSLTAVAVNYSTAGSTLPSSLFGNMSSGSATIPAGQTSVFVPFTVSDDGKIAPTRTLVATLTAGEGGGQVIMNVQNNDVPSLTIDGEQDGADVTLDPEDEDSTSLLAPVAFTVNKDGSLNSTMFTWNPSQDVIWMTDQVGTVGVNDLASMSGVTSDSYGDHYTWTGLMPTKIWAQAIGGSSVVNGTLLSLAATVSKVATQFVASAVASPLSGAAITQSGIWIRLDGSGMSSVVGDPTVAGLIKVGAGVTVTAQYLGPNPTGAEVTDIHWGIDGATTDPKTATAIADYDPGTVLPSADGAASPQVTLISTSDLENASVHFYFLEVPVFESTK